MACGYGDEKICKEEIRSSSNNELTTVIVQDGSSVECLDEWLRSISPTNNTISTKHKIQKIPQFLRRMDNFCQKCYDPQVISIGPYHHGKEALKPMEKIKIRLTREYISSCKGTSVYLIDNKIAGLAEEARKCYADDDYEGSTHHFDNKEFARMMVLDGCSLLQYIFCIVEEKEKELKLKNHEMVFIEQDLFLLENQLPFIVLKALMSFTSFGETQGLQMIKKFIRGSWTFPPPPESCLEKFENFIVKFRTFTANHIKCRRRRSHVEEKAVDYKDDEPAHLLELKRREIIDPNAFETERENDRSFWYSYRSVQELKTAGVIFRPNRSKLKLLTDVRYEPLIVRAILRLPVITIDDSTKSLLLNLVAYEMCPDSPNDFGVSSYLWLMDTLIDHPDDVKELRRKGILLNGLASDEQVGKLFNEISDMVVPNPNAYANVKSQIEKHYKNKVKVWITEFLHTHFTTPWAALAFMGAIVAIALSFIQSYYAIKPSH